MINVAQIIKSGDTIGYVGDGQLARMLIEAAARMGYRARVIGPGGANSSAGRLTQEAWQWSHGGPTEADVAVIDEFADGCDVITCEWESVPAWVLEHLESRGALMRPSRQAFAIASDRALEKQLFRDCGLQTAEYIHIDAVKKDEVIEASRFDNWTGARELTYPVRLKTRRGGYDGHGQITVTCFEELYLAVATLQSEGKLGPYILEGHVSFSYESSVIAARPVEGGVVFYPSGINKHEDGILRRTQFKEGLISAKVQMGMQRATSLIATKLGYIGTLGVEFFIMADGTPIVNEVAPRVHNSGHWTQNGCDIDQFAMHIRAICGWSLPTPRVTCISADMNNLLTPASVEGAHIVAQESGIFVHLYDKQPRDGMLRKCGHVNCIGR